MLIYGGTEEVKGAKEGFGEAVELGLFYIVILCLFIYLF
jgi:hypothetical protein